MNVKRNLISLKAAAPNNYLALEFVIKSFGLKPVSWSNWKNKLGDEITLVDDGQKIKFDFSFKEINDLFQFSSVNSLVDYSQMIILTRKKENIKAWCLGQDNFLRLISFENELKFEHLFSESPSLIMTIINMLLGKGDNINHSYKIDEFLVITQPFDNFIDYKDNNNFNKFWKELEV